MDKCTNCGITVDPTWRFCGECGADVPASVAAGASSISGNGFGALHPRAPSGNGHAYPRATTSSAANWAASGAGAHSRGPITKRQIILGASIFLAVILLAVAVMVHLGVRHQLASTRAELATTAANLQTTQGKLSSSQANLTSMTTERDNLDSQVQDLTSKVDGLNGSLSDARNQVNLAAGQITTLKGCLGGVSIALNDVLHNNYYGAAAALQTVQGVCQQAFAIL